MKPLFLTGFMGAGKSVVGRRLAGLLGVPFVDLDQVVENDAGLSVTEIFARNGEPHFRTLEGLALKRLAVMGGQVIATGGGAVVTLENRRVMKAAGTIVNLRVSVEEIRKRLSGDTTRPLLQGDDPETRVRQLLVDRELCYAEADLVVETSGRSVDEIAEEIVRWLNREC